MTSWIFSGYSPVPSQHYVQLRRKQSLPVRYGSVQTRWINVYTVPKSIHEPSWSWCKLLETGPHFQTHWHFPVSQTRIASCMAVAWEFSDCWSGKLSEWLDISHHGHYCHYFHHLLHFHHVTTMIMMIVIIIIMYIYIISMYNVNSNNGNNNHQDHHLHHLSRHSLNELTLCEACAGFAPCLLEA